MDDHSSKSRTFWIIPVASADRISTSETVRDLVCNRQLFGFSKRGKVNLQIGDKVCFHANQIGVVADASVTTTPVDDHHLISRFYPWIFRLEEVHCYLNDPIILDLILRMKMDAFHKKNPGMYWTWFIKRSHKISEHDFELLTKQNEC